MVERNHHMVLVAVRDKVAFHCDNLRFPLKKVKPASNRNKNKQNQEQPCPTPDRPSTPAIETPSTIPHPADARARYGVWRTYTGQLFNANNGGRSLSSQSTPKHPSSSCPRSTRPQSSSLSSLSLPLSPSSSLGFSSPWFVSSLSFGAS